MFLEDEKEEIEIKFDAMMKFTGNGNLHLEEIFQKCTPEERLCLQYLYASMPVSDTASYDAGIFAGFVRHALSVRDKMPWGKSIPGRIFLDYVLHYRINNENIEECRSVIFNEIYPAIKDKSMLGAAVEINYRCLEKATYRLTDDRTASPVTIIRNAYGRCGEESVLTVTAMRAAGIPARQCYVPRWSHCDDNHAWVEVWIDGEWKFIGACEPEPVLNRGWFTAASSKAMLVHSRAFSALEPKEGNPGEGNPLLKTVNNLETYAKTALLTVKVTDGAKPVPMAEIRFEVLNYSEFYPIFTAVTDEEGKARFLTGLGDLLIHVHKDGLFMTRKVDVRKEAFVELDFSRASVCPEGIEELDMFPPEEDTGVTAFLPEDVLKMHEIRFRQAEKARSDYEGSFYTPASAKKLADRFAPYGESVSEYLVKSRGNHTEMLNFLSNGYDIRIKLDFLNSLTQKDYTDICEPVANEHIKYSLEYINDYDSDIFTKYILCPRIGLEFITGYRGFINGFFCRERKALFRSDPHSIYEYIEANIKDCGELDYGTLVSSPAGLLKLGMGSRNSRKTLFVAVCRTLGIPSRLNPFTKEAEYLQGGKWNGVGKPDTEKGENVPEGRLVIIKKPGDKLVYMQHFTVGILEAGIYKTLDCSTVEWDGDRFSLDVPSGFYRIVTSGRQIDGSILARLYHFELKSGQTMETAISLRENQLEKRLKSLPVTDILLSDGKGADISLKTVVSQQPASVVAVLDVGKEPTEHILNEIYEMREEYDKSGVQLVFIVDSETGFNYGPLERAVAAVHTAKIYVCKTHDYLNGLFRDIKMGDHRLPLSMVIDGGMNAKFAFSNYNVGTAGLLLQIARAGK